MTRIKSSGENTDSVQWRSSLSIGQSVCLISNTYTLIFLENKVPDEVHDRISPLERSTEVSLSKDQYHTYSVPGPYFLCSYEPHLESKTNSAPYKVLRTGFSLHAVKAETTEYGAQVIQMTQNETEDLPSSAKLEAISRPTNPLLPILLMPTGFHNFRGSIHPPCTVRAQGISNTFPQD